MKRLAMVLLLAHCCAYANAEPAPDDIECIRLHHGFRVDFTSPKELPITKGMRCQRIFGRKHRQLEQESLEEEHYRMLTDPELDWSDPWWDSQVFQDPTRLFLQDKAQDRIR